MDCIKVLMVLILLTAISQLKFYNLASCEQYNVDVTLGKRYQNSLSIGTVHNYQINLSQRIPVQIVIKVKNKTTEYNPLFISITSTPPVSFSLPYREEGRVRHTAVYTHCPSIDETNRTGALDVIVLTHSDNDILYRITFQSIGKVRQEELNHN